MSTPTSSPSRDRSISRLHLSSDDESVGEKKPASSQSSQVARIARATLIEPETMPESSFSKPTPQPFLTLPIPSFEQPATARRKVLHFASSPGQRALIAPAPFPKLGGVPIAIAQKRKRGSGSRPSMPAPSLSSSSSSPNPYFLSNSKPVPPTPAQISKTDYFRPYIAEIETVDAEGRQCSKNFQFTRDHFFTFHLPGSVKFLSGDGNYKDAYTYTHSSELIPGIANANIVLLQFKEKGEDHTISAQKLFSQMDTSLKQYFEAREVFGSDKCVNIYNAKKALEDGYFAVEYIPLSLESVFHELSQKVTAPLTSFDDTQNPVVITIKSLLEQIRFFFTKSLEHKIQTDLNIGNFRLFKNEDGSYIVKLTDFREEIDEDDLLESTFFGANSDLTGIKNGELNKLINNRYVKSLISDEAFEGFFKAERELIQTTNHKNS
ncbi:MAG: hypothetical protein K1000chlam1_00235 [Candidatus Anoxychlamydiales bacterium]|nr:hypothetical protein [Candidatus Anoxychlamydiales bacterium]